MTYADAPAEVQRHLDRVDQILTEVRQELSEREARGDLPVLPPGELDRQFTAIIDAVDAGLIESPATETQALAHLATLPSWTPRGESVRSKAMYAGLAPARRFIGRLVRNQVSPFSTQSAFMLHRIVERQNEQARFLAGAHLERLRLLEARVAELELELSRRPRQDDVAGSAVVDPTG